MLATTRNAIRVVLLDDHPIVRKGFSLFVQDEADMELQGTFSKSSELLAFLRTNDVDVLVLDYMLGESEVDGLALIRQLMNHFPSLKILMSTTVENMVVVRLALRFGVRGYVGKSQDTDELMAAIRKVAHGQLYLSPNMEYELSMLSTPSDENIDDEIEIPPEGYGSIEGIGRLDTLTARESEVLRHFLEGMSVLQIAAKFKRSRKTVSGQKQTAMKKLGIKTDAELFIYRDFIL